MTHIKPCILTVDLYNTYRERMPEYVQYDRQIPLEITVMAHGKPADLTGMFARISIGKPDGHHVYHDNVEVAGNIISTTFGDQEFVTAGLVNVTIDLLDGDGSKVALIPFMIRVKPAVITDETIKSSNDYQTIMALIEDVRSLDEMFHVEQDNRAEDFAIQMSQQAETHNAIIAQLDQAKNAHEVAFQDQMDKHNSEFTDAQTQRTNSFDIQMSEWNNAISEQERQRETAEAKRANAENARDNKETERKQNELARETAEQQRVDAESDRKRSEATRNQDEAIRKSNESNRKTYENDRQSEEEKRIASEIERVNNESKRTTNELARITAEADRANQESTRMATESKRATAESARVATESKRATAEKVRVNQEEARRLAEEGRTTRMATWEAKAEKMAQETQEMVSSAQSFINANESRLLEDNARTDYMGNAHNSIKDVMDANIEFVLDEVNTVHYEGQHIIATDTIERQVKQAELKGQTLVNLMTAYKDESVIRYCFPVMSPNVANVSMLEPNTEYTLFYKAKYQKNGDRGMLHICTTENNSEDISTQQTLTTDYKQYIFKFTTLSTVNYFTLRSNMSYFDIKECILLEGDYTNQDIPYFEGMVSVKTPTVKMTGKNLLDPNYLKEQCLKISSLATFTNGNIIFRSSEFHLKRLVDLNFEPNTRYAFNFKMKGQPASQLHILVSYTDFSKSHHTPYISDSIGVISGVTKANATVSYITISYGNNKPDCILYIKECSVFKSEVAVPHEPHKSNILSTSEDVELGSVGDVEDALNVLTGELVESTKEMIFSEDLFSSIVLQEVRENTVRFNCTLRNEYPLGLNATPMISNILPLQLPTGKDVEGVAMVGGEVAPRVVTVGVLKTKLESRDVDGFKKFANGNLIFRYRLAKPVNKTVDLKGQKVYSYDGITHYTCSSAEGTPIPMLSIDVPTNLPALVSRQRNTIQELEKENEVLKEEVSVVDRQRENGDLELLSSDFDIDFRLMEIEFALGVPMIATFKEMRSTARTSYEMAKALILGGKYERSDMEYKLGRYLERKQITQDQYDELIALMDANELT